MRKKLLITILLAASGISSYATTFMCVKNNDGQIVKFDVNDVEEVIFEDKTDSVDTTSSINKCVDLNLPSGTIWATCNIGATKPEEYGDYFAWGETSPKDVYDWNTYKWGLSIWDESENSWSYDSLLKYNSVDSLVTLLPEDDAATANWGSDWRMPTADEVNELIDNCEYSWAEVNGVKGVKFTASNGNFIFFPAAGALSDEGDIYPDGTLGCYWSSSLFGIDHNFNAYDLGISEFMVFSTGFRRKIGFSVRAVRATK